MNGTIKTLNQSFFGFITPEDGSADVFFHSSSLVGVQFGELKEGDKVTFEVGDSPRGPRANNVQRA